MCCRDHAGPTDTASACHCECAAAGDGDLPLLLLAMLIGAGAGLWQALTWFGRHESLLVPAAEVELRPESL